MAEQDFSGWVNSVALVGRVTSEAQYVDLPSGQSMARFRIVIPRTKPTTKTTVDTVDCIAMKHTIQRKVDGLKIGSIVELSGEIRRRFWKSGAGVASRVEVEVGSLKVLKR